MKTIAFIALICAGGIAQADGFQPWNERAIESRPDAVQSSVTPHAYYREPVARSTSARDAEQAEVTVRPWYAGDRV